MKIEDIAPAIHAVMKPAKYYSKLFYLVRIKKAARIITKNAL